MNGEPQKIESAFVRPEEAAAMIGVGLTKFYSLLKDGAVKSSKLGHSRMIARTEVQAFIERLKAEAA